MGSLLAHLRFAERLCAYPDANLVAYKSQVPIICSLRFELRHDKHHAAYVGVRQYPDEAHPGCQ
jgi:hypothetical protein